MTEADRYRELMGKEPPAVPDAETDRQFRHRARGREAAREYIVDRDPGDEDDGEAPVLEGQGSLL